MGVGSSENNIICTHEIGPDDINKDIQIINFYYNDNYDPEDCNKEEIIKKSEIFIDKKLIDFTPVYKFEKQGKYKVKIKFNEPIKNGKFMFLNCKTITKIDGNNFNATKLKFADKMFSECDKLEEIDIDKWKVSNVESMSSMFEKCKSLKAFSAPDWETKKVKILDYMFEKCSSIKKIDITNWDMKNVTSIDSMFYDCTLLEKLDVSKWNTENILVTSYLFFNCHNLKYLDFSKWNTKKMENYYQMFYKLNKNCKLTFNDDFRLKKEHEEIYDEKEQYGEGEEGKETELKPKYCAIKNFLDDYNKNNNA